MKTQDVHAHAMVMQKLQAWQDAGQKLVARRIYNVLGHEQNIENQDMVISMIEKFNPCFQLQSHSWSDVAQDEYVYFYADGSVVAVDLIHELDLLEIFYPVSAISDVIDNMHDAQDLLNTIRGLP